MPVDAYGEVACWDIDQQCVHKVFLTFIDMFDHLNIGKNSEQQCATIVWVLLCRYCSRLCVMYMGSLRVGWWGASRSLIGQSEAFRIVKDNNPVSGGQLCFRSHRVCINVAPPTLPVFIQLIVVGGHIAVGLLYDQVGWCGHSYHLPCYCKCGKLYVFVMYWCVVFVYYICACAKDICSK